MFWLKIFRKTLKWSLFPVLMLASLISCLDTSEFEISGVEINPEFAFPIAFAELSVSDFLEDADTALVEVDDDGLVYLTYRETLETKDINGLFSPQNSNIVQNIPVPAGIIPAQPADYRADSVTTTIDLNLTPAELNRIDFKSGNLAFSTSVSPANANFLYAINVVLPTVSMDGDMNEEPISITTSGNGNLDLSPYSATLDKNKFNLKLVLIYKKNNNAVTIVPNTTVNVTLNFTSMDYKTIYGFFGDRTRNFPDQSISIGTLGTILDDAALSFANPSIKLFVQNEYSVPCNIDFSTFQARKGNASLDVVLNPANPIDLNYPDVIGTSKTTVITVTNAKQLLDFNPDEFYYSATARVNKNVAAGNNALADTSKMKINMEVAIPLYGSASNIVLADTIEIDLPDDQLDKISSAQLNIKSKNELPLSARLQLYLADENYDVFDSLIIDYKRVVVPSSEVTAAGELNAAGESEVMMDIPAAKLGKLFDAKTLLIKSIMNTANNGSQNVKFKAGYKLKLDIGLRSKLKIKSS